MVINHLLSGMILQVSLQLQLDAVCARCMALTAELSASLSSLGVGLPLLIAHFESRAMPSILYGAEVLASCDPKKR